jgi:hypothetical protein
MARQRDNQVKGTVEILLLQNQDGHLLEKESIDASRIKSDPGSKNA